MGKYENHGRCAVVFFFVTIHSPASIRPQTIRASHV